MREFRRKRLQELFKARAAQFETTRGGRIGLRTVRLRIAAVPVGLAE
ncbi:hypothetical protein SDC9_10292 [bioreactor metagenome]|jgi:hypothetical protein|uniref:Uncharacterized protein n=1 Tax=bioreactor metagenome TaxID=1076179 RepID=A0A644TDW1_9ZZZZ